MARVVAWNRDPDKEGYVADAKIPGFGGQRSTLWLLHGAMVLEISSHLPTSTPEHTSPDTGKACRE